MGTAGERGVLSCRRERRPLSSDWRLASLLSLVKLPAFKLEGREETSTTRAGPADSQVLCGGWSQEHGVCLCLSAGESMCVSVLVQPRSE